MHITNFDPNFSIFDKSFIPEPIPNNSIDMEKLKGDQFWPIQNKSYNKLKKIFSKTFKSFKHKVFYKNHKRNETTATKEIMTSKDMFEFDEIDKILDIYLSFQDKHAPVSSNDKKAKSSILAENDTNSFIKVNSLDVIQSNGEDDVPRSISFCVCSMIVNI
ncbi:10482_t:CDS:1 [Funneliformis geosporum]|uniref:8287_t:CDS:1 n=1 Tax=Funneliformis geosporum TaxID=1117311 RepID=A0A9W4X1W6_9GLOM|nr:10482_t:CDS:1 [Funneliformis geosporum]CAI2189158.1 8287_t:CDS:1 [Funneliformis geosporum]